MPLETIIVLSAVLGVFGFFAMVLAWADRQSAIARRVVRQYNSSRLHPAE